MAIRTLIIGDIRLFRDGLAVLLKQHPDVEVLGTGSDLATAMAEIEAVRPDVVVLDTAMQDSLAHVRTLTSSYPDLKVVALAVPETASDVIACAEAGVAGYVAREASIDDLVASLQAAAQGEFRCSARLAASILHRLAELARNSPAPQSGARLTKRELEVLRLLDAGYSNKEIARELGIEVATAKNHVHKILEKLGVQRRTQASSAAAPLLGTRRTFAHRLHQPLNPL